MGSGSGPLFASVGRLYEQDFVGAFDDRDPRLIYKLSAWNLAMAVIFVETILVPFIVVVDETLCPIGRNETGSEHDAKAATP